MTEPMNTKENTVDYQQKYYDSTNQLRELEREVSVVYSAVASMVEYFTRNYQREVIVEAAKNAYDDTGIDLRDVISMLNKYDFDIDESDFRREFQVVVRVPVEVCINVEAIDEDNAEEEAKSILESEGLENYSMEYDMWYDADVTSVEEV